MTAYQSLKSVFNEAVDQAENGKGKERHASGEPFENQQIVEIAVRLKDHPMAGPLQQVVKKIYESGRLGYEKGRIELLGAINYLAAAVIGWDKINIPEKQEILEQENGLLDSLKSELICSGCGNLINRCTCFSGEDEVFDGTKFNPNNPGHSCEICGNIDHACTCDCMRDGRSIE